MMRLSGWTLLICTMGLGLCITGPANAGTITVGQPVDTSAGQFALPVTNTLNTGEAPSTMQFDIYYDPLQVQLIEVAAGSAATDAGKGVSYNVLEPGRARFIAAGVNRDPIGEGTIVGITFQTLETATTGKMPITIRNTVMADADANLIVSHGVDGSIEIDVDSLETSEQDRVLEPIESPDTGDTAAMQPAETLPARVVIPGVVDTVIAKPTARAASVPLHPSADGTATEPEGRYTARAGVPAGAPEEPAALPGVGTEDAGSPPPFPSPAQDVRSMPGPQRTDEIGEPEDREEIEPDVAEPDTAGSATSWHRWKIVAIEAGAVIVALVLFLGARKLFRI